MSKFKKLELKFCDKFSIETEVECEKANLWRWWDNSDALAFEFLRYMAICGQDQVYFQKISWEINLLQF